MLAVVSTRDTGLVVIVIIVAQRSEALVIASRSYPKPKRVQTEVVVESR
jgi:hypothetical protein